MVKRLIYFHHYKDYQNVSMNNFTKNLHLERLKHTPVDIINYGSLDSVVETVLNVHAPIKEKYDRANDRPFMAKPLRPRLHCTGTTSAPEQKVSWFTCVYTAPVQKLYQIALPFTLYRLPLLIKSQYCYCALLKNKNTYHMS